MKISKRNRKLIISVLLGLLISGFGFLTERYGSVRQAVTTNSPGTYTVTKFHDGDTIGINMDGKEESVRMIGVDTPETQDPRKPVQCFGRAASNYTKELIGNNPVRLEADPINQNRDRYDRLLRYVYLPDGTLVQAEIIKNGYGFAYTTFPFTKLEEFKALEKEARDNNRGLWASCQPEITEQGSLSSNPE